MSTADFGQDRFARHLRWRASGRVEGGEEYEEEDAPFTVERHEDRWLWTNTDDGALRAVGDAVRDLVASQGGLERKRSPRGFLSHDGVSLLRRVMYSDEEFMSLELVGSEASEHAGRPAVDFRLRSEKGEAVLGVDTETGIFTYLQAGVLTVTVDTLVTMTPLAHPAFVLLDVVPDVDLLLSHREPVHEALAPVLKVVQEVSGLRAEVVYQEPQSLEFEFALLDADGQVVGRALRRHALWDQSSAIFNGSQSWTSGGEYEVHVDTTLTDGSAASRIEHAIIEAVPDD